jgi:hypothetical protein
MVSIDEVDREELAQGLEKVTKEVTKRLQLLGAFCFSVPLKLKYSLALY